MIGNTVSHYKILSKLGEGGMGVVYRAEDTKLKRTVALKFLPPELTRDTEAKERFIHEAQAAAALNHPHICTIHEIDEHEGQSFIAMEFIEGEGLKDRIQRGPLAIDEVLSIAVQVGEGLQEAHKKAIVHRDIKSANVMLTPSGQVKVMDFGLAKITGRTKVTREGTTLGTVGYMSPEQAQGEDADHRSDIWSLGVVIYEMVTGLLPFRGEYEQGLVYQIINSSPAPLTSLRTGVPMELERIVNKCLEKKRDERYQTAMDLIADLRHLQRTLATGTQVTPQSITTAAGVRPARKPRWAYWAVPVVAVVTVAAVALYVGKTQLSKPGEKPITSIAVLPFDNLSADPEQEYFSDGTTDALIAELSKIQALRVISRTSVMRFKKSNQSLPEIAKQLDVDAVVEGSVQRVQNDVRVAAQLVRAFPEKHMWANTYTETYENILALESEIAQTIAREIRVTMTPDEKERLAASRPVNPAAHEAYLKGHFYVWKLTLPDVEKGIKYLEQAIEIDSTYAPAYVDMAEAYDLTYGSMVSPELSQEKMKTYALKALSIDPTIAEAYAILGDVKLFEWDWKGAEAAYQRAIELNPNDAVAHAYYGAYLQAMGRFDEGLKEVMRAEELNPFDMTMKYNLACGYFFMKQYDKAETLFREVQGTDSTYALTYWGLGSTHVAQGRIDEAVAEFGKAASLKAEGITVGLRGGLAHALARSGRTVEARTILAELIRESEAGTPTEVAISAAYLGLGERDSSLYRLERAYDVHDPGLLWVPSLPIFDDLRSDPRYAALVRKMGLEP